MRLLIFTLAFLGSVTSSADEPLHETSTHQLQTMLNNIEGELSSRGVSLEEKRQRIEKAESRMKKLVSRGSVRNAVVGSVLAAAVTAHPAGIIVGGLAGGLVGKSKRYSKAEEKLAMIEQDIIVDEDDFLTEGEVRLASFSGESDEIPLDQVEEYVAKKYGLVGDEAADGEMIAENTLEAANESAAMPEFDTDRESVVNQGNDYQQMTVANAQGVDAKAVQQAHNTKPEKKSSFELESCYGRSAGDRKSRENLPHCFYMMY